MDIYSKLDGTAPLSPPSGGVWKIRKKSKTDDQRRRKFKRRDGKERDIQDNLAPEEQENNVAAESFDSDEQIGYGSAKKKNRLKRKIDLTI